MTYTNFNKEGVTATNLEAFLEVVDGFAARRSSQAAQRWLTKLNPEVERHISMEFASCGGEYTYAKARQAVWAEFAHQPLPFLCPKCEADVCWYRATSGVMKCQGCGAAIIGMEIRRYLP